MKKLQASAKCHKHKHKQFKHTLCMFLIIRNMQILHISRYRNEFPRNPYLAIKHIRHYEYICIMHQEHILIKTDMSECHVLM